MSKDVLFDKEARDGLKYGLDTVFNAVSRTLGPRGTNVFIDDQISPKFTNDGVSIANAISLPGKFENAGAWVAKNAAGQTNDDAGDGTTTTVVVLHDTVDECIKRPENPMEVMGSILKAKDKVIEKLKKNAKPITKDDLKKVVYVSAEAHASSENKALADTIAEVVGKVGADAIVTVEDRKDGFQTDYQLVQGYEAHVGFMSPYFRNDPVKARAVHEDIAVLCSAKKFATVQDLKFFKKLADKNINSLVVVAEDVEPSILGMFVATKVSGSMNLLVIRATGPLLEDIAAATGSTLIADDTGITFENFDPTKHLGRADRIVCEEKRTLFTSGAKSAGDQAKRLEKMAENNPNMFEVQKYKERAQKLRGGIAVIRIGAYTDSVRNYLKDKAEDAVKAAQAALQEGVVQGGGMELYRIASSMRPKTVGEEILKKSLTSPLRIIVENAGEEYAEVIKNLPEGMGYDASTKTYKDFLKEGIVDPVKVTRCAVENAVSTAALFFTSHAAITEHVEPNEE